MSTVCRPIRRKDKRLSKTASTTERQGYWVNPASQERRLDSALPRKRMFAPGRLFAVVSISGESVVI